jgi:O-antigen ligase
VWLERAILAALFLFAIGAPVSIAATQFAWAVGLLFWLLRFLIWPRPKLDRTPLDYPMLAFFILTGVSSFLSYEPMVSVGKLRAAMLFTIVYLFAQNLRALRLARICLALLIASAVVAISFRSIPPWAGSEKVYGSRGQSTEEWAISLRENQWPCPSKQEDNRRSNDTKSRARKNWWMN